MARKRDRIFAGVMAATFIIATFGVGIAFLYQVLEDNKKNNEMSQAIDASQQKNDTTKNPNALEGKNMDGFTPVANVDTLQIIDLEEGTGEVVKASDTINFDYTGAVASTGKIFQSSLDSGQPAVYPLTSLIAGWQEGIPGMKVGGKRRLLIPSDKAYGPQAQPGIPANSDLVFDITVHSVEK